MTIAMVNMSGWNCCKKKSCHYLDIESARRLVPHCGGVLVPVITCLPDLDQYDDIVNNEDAMDEYSDSSNSIYHSY